MKQIPIVDIAKDIERASKYYIEDAFKSRLDGRIRVWFDEELERAGMCGIIEMPPPVGPFVENTEPGTEAPQLIMHMGNNTVALNRIVGDVKKGDINKIRLRAEDFLKEVEFAVCEYVTTISKNAYAVTVPAIFVRAMAWEVEYFFYGYQGIKQTTTKD